jgi:hypothetical protein
MTHTYRLYGVPTDTTFPLTSAPPRTAEAPVLRIRLVPAALPAQFRAQSRCAFRETEAGLTRRLYRHRTGRRWALQFGDLVSYLLSPDAILCYLEDEERLRAAEIWLTGAACSLWNELCGVPALHAAAVAVRGRGVGVLATSQGGKSSLAAACMEAGHPLLTDDVLMVHPAAGTIVGEPSLPQMRMWPDQARHFLGTTAGLRRVVPHLTKRRVPVGAGGFGTFQASAVPMTHLLLPERSATATTVRLEPVAPQQALIELLRHSFLPRSVAALDLSARRLPVLVSLAQQAAVYRLIYPDGVEHLPRVAAAVEALVAGVPAAA